MKKFILLILSLLALTPALSFAQVKSIGFAVEKGVYDFDVVPGTSVIEEITIANELVNLPLPVRVEMNMWDLALDADEIEYVIPEKGKDATRWFEYKDSYGNYRLLNGANFILPPDGRKDVNIRVAVPSGTESGSYLVAMRIQAAPPDFYFPENGPRFIPEIAILFFVNARSLSLDGVAGYAADIVSFTPAKRHEDGLITKVSASVFDEAVKNFIAQVENTGVYHFKMNGELQIKNALGRIIEERRLPPRYLIPGRVRTLQLAQVSEEERGFFTRQAYLGRYTASLIIQNPDNTLLASTTIAVATTHFWIFPWKLILLLVALVIMTVFIWRYRRRIYLAIRVLHS